MRILYIHMSYKVLSDVQRPYYELFTKLASGRRRTVFIRQHVAFLVRKRSSIFLPRPATGNQILRIVKLLQMTTTEYVLHSMDTHIEKEGKGKLGTYAMKRVAAGAHLPTPWLFEPAKRPDDRADYCLDCSFLP